MCFVVTGETRLLLSDIAPFVIKVAVDQFAIKVEVDPLLAIRKPKQTAVSVPVLNQNLKSKLL